MVVMTNLHEVWTASRLHLPHPNGEDEVLNMISIGESHHTWCIVEAVDGGHVSIFSKRNQTQSDEKLITIQTASILGVYELPNLE